MKLDMFLDNKLIDSMVINIARFNEPGYINGLRLEMEEKHEDVLDLSNEEPQFFIDSVPSSMNGDERRFSN
jgi:hypothetical protein